MAIDIESLAEFAKNGEKHMNGMNQEDGFPAEEKPERQWFNWLFNTSTLKINEIIENLYQLDEDMGRLGLDTGISLTGLFAGIERSQYDKNIENLSVNDIFNPENLDYADIFDVISSIKKGMIIDLEGKTLPSTRYPDDLQLINGAINLNGKIITQPLTKKSHPAAGSLGVFWADDAAHSWAHEVIFDNSTGITHLFAKSDYGHVASPTAALCMYTSEDYGQSIKSAKYIYNRRGYAVAGARGRVMSNGRFGLFMVMFDASNNYTNSFIYSDDKGKNWTAIEDVSIENLPYSDMLKSPFDENTYYVYGYKNAKLQVAKTTDNGLTWTNTPLSIGVTVTEPSVVKLPNENKWIIFIRSQANLFISTSTDMDSWSTPVDTGFNLSNNPVQAVIENGKLYVYMFMRDFSETLGTQNKALLMIDDYDYVYDNKKFSHANLTPAFVGVDRALGYMRIIKTDIGNIFTLNACELDISTSSTGSSRIYIGGNYLNFVPTQKEPRQNLIRNGKFDYWSRADSFTVTGNAKTADGWNIQPQSESTVISKVAVPSDIAITLPHRPKYGMKIKTATANSFLGIFQLDFSDNALQKTQGRVITVQIWGTGEIPNALTASALQNFGVGGSATVIGTKYPIALSNVGADKLWYGTARIAVPSIEGKNIGTSSPYFRLSIESTAKGVWDCTILGIHASFGTDIRPYTLHDNEIDAALCRTHIEAIELDGDGALSSGFAQEASTINSLLTYDRKVKTPVISIVGSLIFYPAQRLLSNFAYSSVSKNAAILVATTDTPTTVGLSGFIRSASGVKTKLIIDCE